MTTYSRLPKPLRDDLAAGRCIPIIGSGFSKNAEVPGGKMPDWRELAAQLGGDLSLGLQDHADAMDVASAYEHEHGRVYLAQRLTELLHVGRATPGRAHRALVRVPFSYVLTTNFDTLIEDAYRAEHIEFFPVTDESQLTVASAADCRVLIKLHGDVYHPERLVSSEEDFDGFLKNNPLMATEVASLLVRRTAILIGYSLSDPNLRQLLHLLRDRLGRLMRPLYALSLHSSPAERSRFERRGVRVVDLNFSDRSVSENLASFFDEMTHAAQGGAVRSLITTQTRVTDDIEEATSLSPIVFFSVPGHRLRLYREYLYPVVVDEGLAPASEADVPLGMNHLAAVEALIQRAVCAVAEPLTPSARKGSQMARRFSVPLYMIDPQESEEQESSDVVKEWTQVADNFRNWLLGTTEVAAQRVRLESEPERLLEQHETRAAVLASFSLLEGHLRRRLVEAGVQMEREKPLDAVLSLAIERDALSVPPDLLVDLEWSVRLRNKLIHAEVSVTRKDARRIIDLIKRLLAL